MQDLQNKGQLTEEI